MSATTAADLAEAFAWRCDGAKETGGGWMVRCPAHEDSTASLSVTPASDKVLLKCFAGCQNKTILDTLGLGWDALFVQPRSTKTWEDPWAKLGPIVALYDYLDASGTLVHQTVRFRGDGVTKEMRQRRPDPARPGRWLRRVKDITQVLYHLPAVIQAIASGETVYLVEGEKDADSLEALGLTATTNAQGAKGWKPHYDASLRGAHLVCLPDFDQGGQQLMANVATRLQGVASSVKLLTDIHTAAIKSDVSDWLAEGHTLAELAAAVAQAPLWTPAEPIGEPDRPGQADAEAADPRPDIYLSTDMTRVVNEAEDAILTMPGAPRVYQRARALTVIAQGVKPPKWLHRPQDLPVMVDVTTTRLMELANQSAQWWRKDKRAKKWEEALPPGWAIETLRERLAWRFPPLEGIITSPTLRPDGSVLDIPGYDPETGLYLHYNGTAFPPIPPAPTRERALQAIKRLKVVIRDFLFDEDCHRSATLAAMLTLVCRFAIMGNTPLFAITANTRGSGKGLLADVISIIGTGRAAPRWPQVSDEEEERKRLLVVALAGYPCLHVDNITRPLGSPALDLALTAPSYSDRILGKTESREVPLTMVWFASGNNLQFQGDMVRRVLPIALDPKMENPETRTDFKHPELVQWVTRWRPRLTVEALTVVKAFYTAECPKPKQALAAWGSFEPWSALIRQALVWAGEPDPYAGRTNLESESDPAYERLETLLKAWAACYPAHNAHTLAQVNGDIQLGANVAPSPPNKWNALKEALGAMDRKYDGQTLHTHPIGEALKKVKGRTIAGQRLVPGELSHSARTWRIELV